MTLEIVCPQKLLSKKTYIYFSEKCFPISEAIPPKWINSVISGVRH